MKGCFDLLGIGFLLALALNLTIPMVIAYVNGADEILFHLNVFGEQTIEVILLPIVCIWGIIAWIRLLRSNDA